MASIDNTIVYLGNLRKDVHSDDLKGHIYDLFRNKLSIQITCNDISINQKADSKYAYVNCYEEHNAKHALDQLDGWKSMGHTHIPFNWNSICKGLEVLACDYKRTPNHKNKTKSEEKKRKGGDYHLLDNTGKVDTLTEDKHHQQQNYHNSYSLYNGDNNPRKFYLNEEHLGNETRTTEFKEGYGGPIKKFRKELFSKYICAFLNSGKGGTLYLGVHDSGHVIGVSCSQAMEDELRLDIDEVIKNITPTIFPKDYDVKFTPVNESDGIRKGDYKVIEITVHGKKDLDRLYSTSHEMFLRREGSVQTLNVEHVQEWFILKNQRTIRQMKEEMKEEMKEQKELYEKRIQDEKELCERRIQNEKQLHEKYERSHNEQKRSKVCVVL